jgi:C4-dicarboxylate-specific signal transduction histidine kinase
MCSTSSTYHEAPSGTARMLQAVDRLSLQNDEPDLVTALMQGAHELADAYGCVTPDLRNELSVLAIQFAACRKSLRLRRQVTAERHRRRDGRTRQRIRMAATLRNVARLTTALSEAQGEAARTVRFARIGELAAAIIHETSQSLTAVLTNSNTCLRWLSRPVPDLGEARRAAQRTYRDAGRAAEVIAGLRALATRTETGRTSIDIDDLIREVADALSEDFRCGDIHLRLDLRIGRPVCGDRVQLQQVLLNLMRNAIDAVLPIVDRPRRLLLRSADGPGGTADIVVLDNGVGLCEHASEHLGQPLFTTKENGMGIGLCVSRAIVEAHGGTLTAAWCVEEGTSFRISLPNADMGCNSRSLDYRDAGTSGLPPMFSRSGPPGRAEASVGR